MNQIAFLLYIYLLDLLDFVTIDFHIVSTQLSSRYVIFDRCVKCKLSNCV